MYKSRIAKKEWERNETKTVSFEKFGGFFFFFFAYFQFIMLFTILFQNCINQSSSVYAATFRVFFTHLRGMKWNFSCSFNLHMPYDDIG